MPTMPQVSAADRTRFREGGWWRDEIFTDDLRRTARDAPDRPAVITGFRLTSDEPDVTITYAELDRYVDRAAAWLVAHGVAPGDRVAVQLANQWQANVVILACARAGAVFCPYFIGTGSAETREILRESEAKVVFCITRFKGVEIARGIAGARGELPALRHQVVVGEPPEGALGFAAEILGKPWEDGVDFDAHRPDADAVFEIMYTSGTTGRPKGVVHTFNTLYAMARAYTEPMGFAPGEVLSTVAAIGGQAGILYGLLAPLIIGGTTVWVDSFHEQPYLDALERYGVVAAYCQPDPLAKLVEEQRARPRRIRLRRIISGSAPIGPELPGQVRDTFGVPLHPLWGMTENGGVTIGRLDDPWDWAVSSDGRPADGMDVRLVDDDGAEVTDASGNLEVRGAQQCLGYYGDAATYAASLHDGWFVTGDIARPDGRGGIKMVGRNKDMINKTGVHVPALLVEGVLATHPRVRDVALVGEPVPNVGEQVVAFVVADGAPPELAELQRHVRAAGMTPQYAPDRLVLIGELPRNANGKVLKRELTERLARE